MRNGLPVRLYIRASLPVSYIKGEDSRLGYKVLGLMFGGVFCWVFKVFCWVCWVWWVFGVCKVWVRIYIKNTLKTQEVGLKMLIFRKQQNHVSIKLENHSNV